MSDVQNAYAPLMQPRFRVETAPDGAQRIVVPAMRSTFTMGFLLFWLCGWSFAGLNVARMLLVAFQPFLALWACGWLLGETFAILTVCWMAAGREALRPVAGDLEISAELFGFSRRKLYRGREIRDLSSSLYVRMRSGKSTLDIPMAWAPRSGSVKFTYGARTVYAAVGLDEAEGQMIVDWLKPRLAKSA